MSQDPESVVRAFFDDMAGGGKLISAIEEYGAEGLVWSNTGLPTAEGKEASKATMQSFIDGYNLDKLTVEYVGIATSGDAVLTERIDHLDAADGSRLMSLPVSGTLVVQDGKITQWRDYFDPTPFLQGG